MKTQHPRTGRTVRPLAIVGGLAAAALALTGCAGGSGEERSTTLVVQQLSQWTPMMEELVAAFEAENPDIKVETQLAAEQTVNAQVIAGNSPPDIAWVPRTSVAYESSMAADALLPLDDVWENQDLDARYGETTAASLRDSDGEPYIVSINSVFYDVVYYNKGIFDEVGITPPSDHRIPDDESLFDIVEKLRGGGYQPLAINGKAPAMYGWMINQQLQSAATDEQMANYLTSYLPSVEVTANYTDPPFVNAIERVRGWAEAGLFQDGYQGQDEPTATALFLQGQAGMVLGGSWMPDDIENAGIDFDWMLLPPAEGGDPSQLISYRAESVGIPAKAEHPEEAKRFIEFWMTDAMQKDAVAGTNTALPAVNTVDTSTLDALHPVTQSIIQDMLENGAPVGWTSAAPGSFAQERIGQNMKLLLVGDLTVDEVAQAQQEALDEVRSQG